MSSEAGGGFYLSSSCISNRKIADTVREFAGRGILNIELSGGTSFYEGIGDDLALLREEQGVSFLIHNYFPPPKEELFLNIASLNKAELENTYSLIRRAKGLGMRLGVGMYSVHAGFTRNILAYFKGEIKTLEPVAPGEKSRANEVFYGNLRFLMEDVFHNGFRLAVENNYTIEGSTGHAFLCDPAEIWEFLEFSQTYPNMGFLLDMGHLNLSAEMLGFDRMEFLKSLFSRYPDKVYEIHVSGNDGLRDAHEITGAESWQVKALKTFRDELEDIPVVFEWRKGGIDAVSTAYRRLVSDFKE